MKPVISTEPRLVVVCQTATTSHSAVGWYLKLIRLGRKLCSTALKAGHMAEFLHLLLFATHPEIFTARPLVWVPGAGAQFSSSMQMETKPFYTHSAEDKTALNRMVVWFKITKGISMAQLMVEVSL